MLTPTYACTIVVGFPTHDPARPPSSAHVYRALQTLEHSVVPGRLHHRVKRVAHVIVAKDPLTINYQIGHALKNSRIAVVEEA